MSLGDSQPSPSPGFFYIFRKFPQIWIIFWQSRRSSNQFFCKATARPFMSKFHNLRSLAVHLLRQLRCFRIRYVYSGCSKPFLYIPTQGIHSTQKQLGQLEWLLTEKNPELRRALETINNCQRTWPSLTCCQSSPKSRAENSNILANDGTDISQPEREKGGGKRSQDTWLGTNWRKSPERSRKNVGILGLVWRVYQSLLSVSCLKTCWLHLHAESIPSKIKII